MRLLPIIASALAAAYREYLSLNQFEDGKLLTRFDFDRDLEDIQRWDYDLMPKPLGEIIQAFDVDELHLTFTKGRWDLNRWGPESAIAPAGVQLRAWLANGK